MLHLGELIPVLLSLDVDLAQFPLSQRIVRPTSEASCLRVFVDAEVELHENGALPDDVFLEPDHAAEEVPVLLLGAEPEYRLDDCAVVPGSVEQNDLASGRETFDVSLEVPLRDLLPGWPAKG